MIRRIFGNQEPLYFVSDRFVRPVLVRLAKWPRFRFALHQLCDDILYEARSAGQRRISDEDVAKFAAQTYTYGQKGLDADIPFEQRRTSFILPLLEPVLAGTVLEVGYGNGATLEYLAAKYPSVQFIGIDFRPMQSALPNLAFRPGYVMDLLGDLRPDVVYFQLTAVKMLPLEVADFFALMKRIGVKTIVLNEPTRARRKIGLDGPPGSAYLDGRMWKHDYPGLARANGYSIKTFRFEPISALVEPRYNVSRGDTWYCRMIATRD